MSNRQISAKIIELVASGMNVADAYDAVFGAGAYVKLAGMIYDELNAR